MNGILGKLLVLPVKPKAQNISIAAISNQQINKRIQSGKISFASDFAFDKVNFSSHNYSIKTKGKITKIVSFTGKPKLPNYSLRTPLIEAKQYKNNCEQLAKSEWNEGLNLELTFIKDSLIVSHPNIGKLGKVDHFIASEIKNLIDKGYDIEASLSDIEGKGENNYPYKPEVIISYKNLKYKKSNDIPLDVIKVFSKLLNDPNNKNIVKFYQPALKPSECLELLIPTSTVNNILREIDKAKNILLIGHKYSDGDTIGCVLGLRSALNKIGKNVDCSIDDKPDGLYRHKIPGIDEYLKTPDKLPAEKKYDLVMILDTSSTNLIGNHKKFIKSADKVIFIDHHKPNKAKWNKEGEKVGINLNNVINDNLLWIREELPAAAQMITALIFNMLPEKTLKDMTVKEKQNIAKPLVAGIATDTLFFKKDGSENAEGLSKFLMEWGNFSRKWIRDTIKYDLPLPAKEKLDSYINKSITIDKKNNFASIQIPYQAIMDVFNTAQKYDNEVTKTDIVNQFKYHNSCEDIRYDSNTGKKSRVTACLIQVSSKKAGDNKDEIVLSLRSPKNSDIANRIAKLFKGGGHSDAAATRIYNQDLFDKNYKNPEAPNKRITLERKLAKLASSMQISEQNKKKRA